MSNALAALYAWRALEDRRTAATFRKFGYHASADHVERRADRMERLSNAQSEAAPQFPTGPLRLPTLNDSQDSDLHTTSDGNEQTGLFAEQEPPA
jgi:hypothetical protein